jgi:glycosyltransferase involved in cell wall biosynthesis
MQVSVIVRSRNEADRLRLTLVSLAAQTVPAEVVVVNDGSDDHTDTVLGEVMHSLRLIRVDHSVAMGRSAAANAGAARASGDVLLFLDGDTLAAPDLVATHLAVHRSRTGIVARGETHHLRGTRPLLDPEQGTPFPGQEDQVRLMPDRERKRAQVSRAEIQDDFVGVDARSQPGIYPGAGPRQLFELEMAALRDHPDCPALWVAASGSNQSVPRAAFMDAGGFDPDLSINEHRELALRLSLAGLKMVAAGSRTYHMIHRSGWRDPLEDRDWEARFYQRHPVSEVALLAVLWESLSNRLPEPSRIYSITALVEAARRCDGILGCDAVRAAHAALTASVAR